MGFSDDENNQDIPEPTEIESKEIKAISKDAVHKICSGQVSICSVLARKLGSATFA